MIKVFGGVNRSVRYAAGLAVLCFFLVLSPAISSAETYVSGLITADTTWTVEGSPYIVTGDITVRYVHRDSATAVLTIEPGVTVRFEPGTGIYVGYEYYGPYWGALSAQGTAEAPITFTSNAARPAPGDWKGIYFRNQTNDGATLLEHCVIEYGGYAQNANIFYNSATPAIRSSTIHHGSGHGIYLASSSTVIENNLIKDNGLNGIYSDDNSAALISGNILSNNGQAPIDAHPHGYRNISDNTGSDNGFNHFKVRGGIVSSNTTWSKQGFAYVVLNDITVRYGSRSSATSVLTIEPGVTVRFDPGTGMYVGYDYYGPYWGALSAQGTAEAPVTFTSNAATPSPGDWKGIYFRDQTNNELTAMQYCIVEYGGHTHNANIVYVNTASSIRASEIRHGSGHGIYLSNSPTLIKSNRIESNQQSGIYLEGTSNPQIGGDSEGNIISANGGYGIHSADAAPYPLISSNTISDNGSYPIRVGAHLRVSGNTITGNAIQAIETIGEVIPNSTTWGNEGVPYVILSDVTVRHADRYSATAILTIEPGVTVRFDPGTGMYVGYDYYGPYWGALSAQGTAEAPVTFTSNAATPSPGDWRGIYFRDQTNNELSALQHCIVEYGGHTHNANIVYVNTASSIRASEIRHSSGHGIYLSNSPTLIKSNRIESNQQSGIYLEGTSNPQIGGDSEGNIISANGGYGIHSADAAPYPLISSNTISDNGSYPIRVGAHLRVSGNTITGNGKQAIEIIGEVVPTNTTWGNEGVPYVVFNDITVRYASRSSATSVLTIEPGVTVRFEPGTGMYVGYDYYGPYWGALSAQGTAEAPITFTSNATTPAPGDWKGIYFRNQTDDGQTLLEHCIFEYGGLVQNANLYLVHARPTIQYNTIRNSSHSGIYVYGTGSNNAVLRCNNLKDNVYGVYTAGNAQPLVNDNNFLRNQQYGLYNESGVLVDAVDNWWGDVDGPGYNGDDVFGSVNVNPWLTAASDCINTPPTNSPPFSPKNPTPAVNAVRVPVVAEGVPAAVTVTWAGGDPNPWDTVVYDVYFGTAADALALVAEDVAETHYDKSGLEGGTTYFWKITARDDAGAETSGPVWHFTTLGDPPDLIVSDLAFNPDAGLQAGQTITFTATIENTGSGPVVDTFQVQFSVDGQPIGSRPVNPVVPVGGSVQVTYDWVAQTGSHTIAVDADSGQAVLESFEENNSRSTEILDIVDPTPPDRVSTVPAEGASVKQASAITFTLVDQYGVVDAAAAVHRRHYLFALPRPGG